MRSFSPPPPSEVSALLENNVSFPEMSEPSASFIFVKALLINHPQTHSRHSPNNCDQASARKGICSKLGE